MSIGELVNVPASAYRNATHVSVFNGGKCDFDSDFSSLDEVKDEVKKECDGKKDEESKTNSDSREKSVDNQSDQPMHDDVDLVVPETNDNTHSAQKCGGNINGKSLKKHKCDFCEYSALCKSHLMRHLLKHTGDKPHACNFCPKRFKSSQSLRIHMKAHVKEFLFHCSGYLQGFDAKDEKIKREIICKICRYECHFCKESFGSLKANLMNHIRVHSGERPFLMQVMFQTVHSKRQSQQAHETPFWSTFIPLFKVSNWILTTKRAKYT